jgi:hypothetical protein
MKDRPKREKKKPKGYGVARREAKRKRRSMVIAYLLGADVIGKVLPGLPPPEG